LLHSPILLLYLLVFGARAPVGQGLLIHEVSRSQTTTHDTWYEFSGRVISPLQRPLPYNIHKTHSWQTSTPPVWFEPTISAELRLKPRGHWDRHIVTLHSAIIIY